MSQSTKPEGTKRPKGKAPACVKSTHKNALETAGLCWFHKRLSTNADQWVPQLLDISNTVCDLLDKNLNLIPGTYKKGRKLRSPTYKKHLSANTPPYVPHYYEGDLWIPTLPNHGYLINPSH